MEKGRMFTCLEELPDRNGCIKLAEQHLEKYRHLLAETDGFVERTMVEIARELVESAARISCILTPPDVKMILDRAMAITVFNYYDGMGSWEREKMLRDRTFHRFTDVDVQDVLRKEVRTAGVLFNYHLQLAADCWLQARDRKWQLPGVDALLPPRLYPYDPLTGRLGGFGFSKEEDYEKAVWKGIEDARQASNYDGGLRLSLALAIYRRHQTQEV